MVFLLRLFRIVPLKRVAVNINKWLLVYPLLVFVKDTRTDDHTIQDFFVIHFNSIYYIVFLSLSRTIKFSLSPLQEIRFDLTFYFYLVVHCSLCNDFLINDIVYLGWFSGQLMWLFFIFIKNLIIIWIIKVILRLRFS